MEQTYLFDFAGKLRFWNLNSITDQSFLTEFKDKNVVQLNKSIWEVKICPIYNQIAWTINYWRWGELVCQWLQSCQFLGRGASSWDQTWAGENFEYRVPFTATLLFGQLDRKPSTFNNWFNQWGPNQLNWTVWKESREQRNTRSHSQKLVWRSWICKQLIWPWPNFNLKLRSQMAAD